MFQISHHRNWLVLLTAILLLMQSFAVWHDAEHAFHAEDEQCESFEAFAKHSPINTLNSIPALHISRFILEITVFQDDQVNIEQRDAYTIRAPPRFFS